MNQEDARRLAKELEGVIVDVEEGDGFDTVCLDTVKYVRDALLMIQPKQESLTGGDERRHMTKDEALSNLKAVTELFGPDEGVWFTQKAWSEFHSSIQEALANVPTSDTSQDRVDKTEKQRHEQEPVIDKSAAVRIATALGWEPKRTWVGLTDEDKQIAFDDTQEGGGFWEFADAIEAKLKEKNT